MTVHPIASGVKGFLGWVACRFENGALAGKYMPCSPSGKYNQHYFTGYDCVHAVEVFAGVLDWIVRSGGQMLEECRAAQTGTYRVRVNRQQVPNDPHCYVEIMGPDGVPALVTSTLSWAAVYTWETAMIVAQQWANWLGANGYPSVAKRLRIVPATGGAETLWRAAPVDSPPRAARKSSH
jgi:hypothetical protein